MPPKDLETALSLRRTKEIELFPKVNTFLHSIARNSIKSKRSYSSGLTLLQNFLNEKEQQTKYEACYNCETILQPLFENKINVYELFDSLISYILGTKPEITVRLKDIDFSISPTRNPKLQKTIFTLQRTYEDGRTKTFR